MANKVQRLVEIGVNAKTEGAERGLAGVTKAITGVELKHIAMAATIVAGTAAIVKAFNDAAKAAYALVEETARIGDTFDKMSLRTSLSTETLSEWSFILQRAGGDVGQLERGLQGMVRLMRDSQEGLETANRAWRDLGVEVMNADGSLRDVNSVLYEARARIAGMENETEATALAMEIFGRAGRQLIPVLRLSNEEFKSQTDLVKELGGVYSGDFVRNSAEFIDAQLHVKTATDGVKIAITEAFSPALIGLMNEAAEAAAMVGDSITKHTQGIKDFSASIGEMAGNLIHYTKIAAASIQVFARAEILIANISKADLGKTKGDLKALEGAIISYQKASMDYAFDRAGLSFVGNIEDAGEAAGKAAAKVEKLAEIVQSVTPAAAPAKDFSVAGDEVDWLLKDAELVDELVGFWSAVRSELEGITEIQEELTDAQYTMNDAVFDLYDGLGDVAGRGVSTLLGMREEAFRMGDAIRNVIVSALEEMISKLIVIRALNAFGLPFAQGGIVPGYAQGGKIQRAAAGMVVPNSGAAGLDSVPILAMPGEGVIKRDTMQQLELFLASQNNAVAPMVAGPGGGGDTHVHYQISRPVSYRDHLDLGESAARAARDATRRVL
jgi:hypothetical protein